MKRIALSTATRFACLLLVLGLASCDLSGGKPRIGVALHSVEDSLIATTRKSLESQAKDKALLSVLDAKNDQNAQNKQIDAMFADKASSVIVNPADTSAMGALVLRAMVANVPIVLVSRESSAPSVSLWEKAYYVGFDSVNAARFQAEIIADNWKARAEIDANGDGKLQYLLVLGDNNRNEAVETAAIRKASFEKAGITAVELQLVVANWSRAEAMQVITATIAKLGNQRIEAVMCANDDMALGVVDGLKVANYMSGSGDMVPVVGIDGTSFAIDAIGSGSLLGTVRIDAANQAKAIFDIAFALSEGKDPKSTGWIPGNSRNVVLLCQKVTRDNYLLFQE